MSALLGLLNILPGWLWAVITAGAIATSCTQSIRLDLANASHATYKADVERLRSEAIEKARQTEKELQDAADQAQKEADALRVERDAANTAANLAAQRLQRAANAAIESARSKCKDTEVAGSGTTARDPIGVLGIVLGELDQFAAEVAEGFDRSREAGLMCERLYESVRQANQ